MRKLLLAIAVLIAAAWPAGCTSRQGDQEKAEFNVATYNIRQLNNGDRKAGNGWERRYPIIASLVRFHDFDIFGTQEGFKSQLEDLKGELGDGDTAGEHSAIFYRTDLFEVVDKGDFWLSETPDRPGLGWDAACPRICSWGRFKHLPSGKEFLMFNLHLDHVGKQARIESAKLVMAMIDSIGIDCPAFVTGDFNVDQTHESYRTFTGSGKLEDSYLTAKQVYALNGTFNAYYTDGFSESRIDHIFVTPGVKVEKYGVLTDTYRSRDNDSIMDAPYGPDEIDIVHYRSRTPSDHFPVKIRVEI